MKKSLEKNEMMEKGFIDISDSLDTVVGGRRAAWNFVCNKGCNAGCTKPGKFHRGMFIPKSRLFYRQSPSLVSYTSRKF